MLSTPCDCHCCRHPGLYVFVRFEDLPNDVDSASLGHSYSEGILLLREDNSDG